MVENMIAGNVTEVHDVMAAAEEAQLAFELLLETRNRLLESYQEIMRMQI
jgi:flagellar hook-basal body complex protein FliE